MGQSNSIGSLSNEGQMSKVFTTKGRNKQLNLTYLQHLQTRQEYLLRDASFNDQTEQLQTLARLRQRQNINSPYLTNLVKYQNSREENLCSRYFRVISLWQYPRRTLAEQINERALVKRPFSEGEMRELGRQLAEGMLVLQKNRSCHQCLTTKSVLVQQAGQYRVVDPATMTLYANLDLIYNKRTLKNIYLSPEQCRIIEQQDMNRMTLDPHREDVFAAGMILLEAGLLERQDECYEQDCARVNWNQLKANLKKFQISYGSDLRKVVEQMLARETSNRIDWQQIVRLLSQPQTTSVVREVEPLRVSTVNYKQPAVRATVPAREVSPVRVTPRVQQQRGSYPFRYNPVQVRTPVGFNHPVQNFHPVQRNPVQVHHPVHMRVPSAMRNSLLRPKIMNPTHRDLQPMRNSRIAGSPTNPNNTNRFSFVNGTQPLLNRQQLPASSTSDKPALTPTIPNQFKISSPTLEETVPRETAGFDLGEQPVYVQEKYDNGASYDGYKLHGKREGWGKYKYQEGGCYEGGWKNGLMCGRGKLYYQSGKIAYDGQLQNDLFHGLGILYNELPEQLTKPFNYRNFEDIEEYWISYNGQFRLDKKEGHGVLLITNGQSFQGSFHEDKVQGEGVYRLLQGRNVRGVWHENRFQRQLS